MLNWIENIGTGADDMDTRSGNEIAGREYSDFVTSEEYVSTRLCNVSDNNDSPDLSQFEVEKVNALRFLRWMFWLRTPLFHELLESAFLYSYLLCYNLKH